MLWHVSVSYSLLLLNKIPLHNGIPRSVQFALLRLDFTKNPH